MSITNRLMILDAPPPAAPLGRRAAALVGHLRAPLAALRRWRERDRQRWLLHRLDERLLRDIGLTRADVERHPPLWRIDPRL